MNGSIYDEIGGFTKLRKIISRFYDNIFEHDELMQLFENVNMERLIDHQTKFFATLMGGPVSFTDEELQHAHKRLNINPHQFDLTKGCLIETLEEHDLTEDQITAVSSAYEEKRHLIVRSK